MKRQKGKCVLTKAPGCGLYIKNEDVVEVDHIVPKAEGGKDYFIKNIINHFH
jgi:RNA-directed DNA polymerase